MFQLRFEQIKVQIRYASGSEHEMQGEGETMEG